MNMETYRFKLALREFRRAKNFYNYLYPGKSPILISPACKFILEKCDSSFLFDSILKSQELKILKDVNFKIYKLRQLRNDMSWTLSCYSDLEMKPLIKLSLPFSNFPLQEITIWVIQNVAILPQER
jgi:hypothetical protein